MTEYPYGLELWRNSESCNVYNMSTMHSHSSHEVYFLITGQRRYFIGHTIYDVAPGNLVFIPKTQLHRTTTPGEKGYDRYVINFYDEDYCQFIELLSRPVFIELMNRGCLQLPSDMVHQVYRDLEQIEQELREPSVYSKAIVSHLFQDVLLIALRYGSKKTCYQGENTETIQGVARYISEHYASWITLDEAAHMAHMEKTYFSKQFKKLTGFGFLEYLTQTRLCEAERLLRETRISMGAIAELCGFSSSNYFGDVFYRWKNIAPTQYRKLHRGEQ